MATLEELLAKLDLSKFAEKFKAEDVDLEAAKALSEDDMQQLGLTLGARKKLYLALHGSGPSAPAAAAASATPAPKAASAATGTKTITDINPLGWRWMHEGRCSHISFLLCDSLEVSFHVSYWPGNASGLTSGAGITLRMEDGDDRTL
jgi:hypothetical protein